MFGIGLDSVVAIERSRERIVVGADVWFAKSWCPKLERDFFLLGELLGTPNEAVRM